MISMSLSEIVSNIDGNLIGSDLHCKGVSTDTRCLTAGQLFVALRGLSFDGHDYLKSAQQAGAVAAVVEQPSEVSIPQIVVKNTRLALGQLAAAWRDRFEVPLVAVTGSNGKTTVKELIISILTCGGDAVLGTTGNLNNDIGVPLTLFRLSSNDKYAVVEMGANHSGEIANLCQIAKPTLAVVTQCAPAHLEGFGSIEAVAYAKGEIFTGLVASGVAIINADDQYAGLWRSMAGERWQLSFGIENPADVMARNISRDADEQNQFELSLPEGQIQVSLKILGRHNIMNALAASACAHVLGISVDQIKKGLESMLPVHGRLERVQGLHDVTIIDDTYNANPESLKAGIEVLKTYPGERWLILGDMGELGIETEKYHALCGEYARAAGIDRLFAIGPLSRLAAEGFGSRGLHFTDYDQLIAKLHNEISPHITLLVKGSRSMHMERIVKALTSEQKQACS